MVLNRKQLGAWGERVAREFLIKKGYIWLASNLKIGRGELDLIFKDGKGLIVVEVKTKRSNKYGEPAEMVDQKKIKQIEYLIDSIWINKKLKKDLGIFDNIGWRIDVVAVYGNGKVVDDIIHYENITMW